MVGWQHQLNEHEFEQILGDSEGQGKLVCCGPQGRKESDYLTIEQKQENIYTYNQQPHTFYSVLCVNHDSGMLQ